MHMHLFPSFFLHHSFLPYEGFCPVLLKLFINLLPVSQITYQSTQFYQKILNMTQQKNAPLMKTTDKHRHQRIKLFYVQNVKLR